MAGRGRWLRTGAGCLQEHPPPASSRRAGTSPLLPARAACRPRWGFRRAASGTGRGRRGGRRSRHRGLGHCLLACSGAHWAGKAGDQRMRGLKLTGSDSERGRCAAAGRQRLPQPAAPATVPERAAGIAHDAERAAGIAHTAERAASIARNALTQAISRCGGWNPIYSASSAE